MGKTIIYGERLTGRRYAIERWETVGTKMGQGQLWKIMCVRREEGKEKKFFSV